MDNTNSIVAKIIIPILNGITIFFAIFILIFYFKNKSFLNYSYFNIIILCFILLFDNILRIIEIPSRKTLQYIQASLLVFFDKLLLLEITMQAVIFYLGLVKLIVDKTKIKKIFFITLIISISISLILTAILMIDQDIVNYGNYFYCGSGPKKKIVDGIFTSILICVNAFCFIFIIATLCENNKDAKKHGLNEELGYLYFLVKMGFTFLINILIFVESYLIIFDILDKWDLNTDLIYLITCLILNIFYMINKSAIDAFCCRKKNGVNNIILNVNDEDENEENEDDDYKNSTYKRTASFI